MKLVKFKKDTERWLSSYNYFKRIRIMDATMVGVFAHPLEKGE
ncbi:MULTISPECIES: hypothetical protein [Bacillus]|nr:hypothetical protein [Bacillus cereus]